MNLAALPALLWWITLYLDYQIVCPFVRIGSPHPLSPPGSVSPHWNQRGVNTRLRVRNGGGGSQFGRLERKPGTLCTLSTLCFSLLSSAHKPPLSLLVSSKNIPMRWIFLFNLIFKNLIFFLRCHSHYVFIISFLKYKVTVQHVTGTGSGLLGGIPRVVVQISALTLKGPL